MHSDAMRTSLQNGAGDVDQIGPGHLAPVAQVGNGVDVHGQEGRAGRNGLGHGKVRLRFKVFGKFKDQALASFAGEGAEGLKADLLGAFGGRDAGGVQVVFNRWARRP